MIIARGTNQETGEELVILGLSRSNIAQLTAGKGMDLSEKTHPGIPNGWRIHIIFGETEEAIYQAFVKAGAIKETTEVHRHPRL